MGEELAASKLVVDAEVETTVAPDVEWNSKLKKLGDEIDETKFEIAQTHKECRILNEELEGNERKNELLHNAVEKTKEALRREQAKLDKENQELEAKTKESEAKEKELQVFTEIKVPQIKDKDADVKR